MKTKKIDAISKKKEEILTSRANELITLQEAVATEAKKIEDAEREMQTASDKGDLNSYQEAKKKRQDAVDAKEMRENRVRKLTEATLISTNEYEKIKADVFAEMDENTEAAKNKLKDLCDQIAEVANDLREAGHKANETLKGVQQDLYGNYDRERNGSGILLGRPLEYTKHYDVLGWAVHSTNGEIYKRMKAQEGGS